MLFSGKLLCYHCSQKIFISEAASFEVINCPSCQGELTVPMLLDQYVLTEKFSESKSFFSAKAYREKDFYFCLVCNDSNLYKKIEEFITRSNHYGSDIKLLRKGSQVFILRPWNEDYQGLFYNETVSSGLQPASESI